MTGTHEDGLFVMEPEDWRLFTEVIQVCGCGHPGLAYEAYRTVLRNAANKTYQQPEGMDETLFLVVAGVLDHHQAIQHGVSLWGSWLEPKGQRLLDLLDSFSEDYDATPCTNAETQ